MTSPNALPDGFEELERWVDDWALATENQRWKKRLSSSYPELQSFYQAVQPLLEQILDQCDKHELGRLPPAAERLFDLALMLSEVSAPVERYKDKRVPHSFPEEKFVAAQGDVPH